MTDQTQIVLNAPILDAEPSLRDKLNAAGHRMWQEGSYEASLAFMQRCLALEPGNADAMVNVGAVEWSLGRYDLALKYIQMGLDKDPTHLNGMVNLAKTYNVLGRWGDAEQLYNRALELKPGMHEARFDRGINRLDMGNWKTGFRDYESRMQVWPDKYQKLPAPLWQGEALNGKMLYVQGEQGIGDTILFTRYLQLVKQTWPGAEIMFCVAPEMLSLYWAYKRFVTLLPVGVPFDMVDKIDYAVHLASLPGIMGTRPDHIPPDPGCLDKRAETTRYTSAGRFQMPPPNWPGVVLSTGLVWAGNPRMVDNRMRTVPFGLLLDKLGGLQELLLISLQHDPGRAEMLGIHGEEAVCDVPGVGLTPTFVHTAMAMKELDVMVTSCTSTAHLAGACNIPTILLLCYSPYWVWRRVGSRTAWYSSIEIIRQRAPNDWSGVVDELKERLLQRHQAKKARLDGAPAKSFAAGGVIDAALSAP